MHDVHPGVRPCDQVSVGEFNFECRSLSTWFVSQRSQRAELWLVVQQCCIVVADCCPTAAPAGSLHSGAVLFCCFSRLQRELLVGGE